MGNSKNILCDRQLGLLEKKIKKVERMGEFTNNPLDDVKDSLNNMKVGGLFSDAGDLINASQDLVGSLQLPDFNLDEIDDFMEKCLSAKTNFGPAMNAVNDAIKNFTSPLRDSLSLLAESFPEFDVCIKMRSLDDTIKDKFNMPNIREELAGFLNCLHSICKIDDQGNVIPEFEDKITANTDNLLNTYGNMNINPVTGKLDKEAIYNEVGLDSTQKGLMAVSGEAVDIVSDKCDLFEKDAKQVSKGKDVTPSNTYIYTHYNIPEISSTCTFYNSFDSGIKYKDSLLAYWNTLKLPDEKIKKIGMLDITIEIIETSLEEYLHEEIDCFSSYKSKVRITIGGLSHESDMCEFVEGRYIYKQIGYYPLHGFTECTENDLDRIKKLFSSVIMKSIKNAMVQFTKTEIEGVL